MALIQEKDRIEIAKRLAGMTNPVKLVNFTQEKECAYCKETRQLMEELASISDKISLETYDFVADKAMVEKYRIDKIPATVITGAEDKGIRFYGIPSGYEFSTLLEGILMVSSGDSGLPAEIREQLANIHENLHLQVYVTPTCPYCPQAVHLAHQFAMENPNIVADMVEATEFPHLSQRYGVMGVPKTIANDQGVADGAMPAEMLLEKLAPLFK